MVRSTLLLRACAAVASLASVAFAQSLLPPERVRLDSLDAFQPPAANWRLAGGLAGDPRVDKALTPVDGTGLLVCTPTREARGQLFTAWEHGDLELDLEFLMLPGADSGIYLQGRYEVQMRDSWGKADMTFNDNGAIYQTWDEAKPRGEQGTGGSAPKANASRAPGLWQHYHIEFEGPRFDAQGNKIKNARFVKVVLNGFVVQEDVEVPGPTRGAAFQDEKPTGPLMIQGNNLVPGHAVRNITVKRFGPERIAVEGLRYKFYSGEFEQIGDYDALPPTAEGVPAEFAHGVVEKSGQFALVFTGTLVVPKDGLYAFGIESASVTRLTIRDRTVVVPLGRNSAPGVVQLAAGRHPFRLDMKHGRWGRHALDLVAEGPGIPPHTLTVRDVTVGGPRTPRQLLVEPKDRALVQRGFVPFEPRKRLYAVSVGTPQGVHFAYDTETGAPLRVWRGKFLDTFEMWDGRGYSQLAKPVGPALTLHDKPAFALIENSQAGDWPDEPEPLWTAHGYELGEGGLPVFSASLSGVKLRDRFAPSADGRGLVRTIETAGDLPEWSAWVLLAEGETISPQPDGRGWIVGDREWYVDWPADAAVQPIVRTANGRQQLAVPLTGATLEKPISYTLVW